jgi:hypothetical protein
MMNLANPGLISVNGRLLLEIEIVELVVLTLGAALVGALLVILYQRLSQRRQAEQHRLIQERTEVNERSRAKMPRAADTSIPRPLTHPAPTPATGSAPSKSLDFHH